MSSPRAALGVTQRARPVLSRRRTGLPCPVHRGLWSIREQLAPVAGTGGPPALPGRAHGQPRHRRIDGVEAALHHGDPGRRRGDGAARCRRRRARHRGGPLDGRDGRAACGPPAPGAGGGDGAVVQLRARGDFPPGLGALPAPDRAGDPLARRAGVANVRRTARARAQARSRGPRALVPAAPVTEGRALLAPELRHAALRHVLPPDAPTPRCRACPRRGGGRCRRPRAVARGSHRLARNFPDARLTVLSNVGHAIPFEQPLAIAKALTRLRERITAAPGAVAPRG